MRYVNVRFPVPDEAVLKDRTVRNPGLGEYFVSIDWQGEPTITRAGEDYKVLSVIVEKPKDFLGEPNDS